MSNMPKITTFTNRAIKRLSARALAKYGTVGGLLAAAGMAHAELPAAVATAITAAQTDMLAAIGLVIGAMVAVWGLLKLASKLGWR